MSASEVNKCSLCLCGIFEEPRTQTARGPCGHVWHTGCIRRWLEEKPQCPECKRTLHQSQVIIPAVVLDSVDNSPLLFSTKEEILAEVAELKERLAQVLQEAPAVQVQLQEMVDKIDQATIHLEHLVSQQSLAHVRVSQTLPTKLTSLKTQLQDAQQDNSKTELSQHGRDLFPRGKIDVLRQERGKTADLFSRIRLMWEGVVDDESRIDGEIKNLSRKLEKEKKALAEKQAQIAIDPKKTKTLDFFQPLLIKEPRKLHSTLDARPGLPRSYSRPGEDDLEVVSQDHKLVFKKPILPKKSIQQELKQQILANPEIVDLLLSD